jgi:hypothetical protein
MTTRTAGIRLVMVVALALAAVSPAVVSASGLLGARLDTSGTWVSVTSKATIPTIVSLTSEGDVTLAETETVMEPGDVWRVPYTGSGLGWVEARMAPVEVADNASALVLRAWVRYVAPPETPALWPWALAILAAVIAAAATWRYRHARES